MALSKYEMETHIYYNQDSPFAQIQSGSKAMTNKLMRLCDKYPEYYKFIRKDDDFYYFEMLKRYVRVGKPMERNPNSNNLKSEE